MIPGSYYHVSFMPQGIHPASRREHKPVKKRLWDTRRVGIIIVDGDSARSFCIGKERVIENNITKIRLLYEGTVS